MSHSPLVRNSWRAIEQRAPSSAPSSPPANRRRRRVSFGAGVARRAAPPRDKERGRLSRVTCGGCGRSVGR